MFNWQALIFRPNAAAAFPKKKTKKNFIFMQFFVCFCTFLFCCNYAGTGTFYWYFLVFFWHILQFVNLELAEAMAEALAVTHLTAKLANKNWWKTYMLLAFCCLSAAAALLGIGHSPILAFVACGTCDIRLLTVCFFCFLFLVSSLAISVYWLVKDATKLVVCLFMCACVC